MPLPNGLKIISQSKRQAQITMRVPVIKALNVTRLPHVNAELDSQAVEQNISETVSQSLHEIAGPDFRTIDDITPKDSDYIYPLFRALSQGIVEGYWIDYSKPGVLEASVPLLQGQTVYTDHFYWRVENWVGSVNNAFWDAKGEKSGGVPGINTELKIDAILNPKIARGLLMKPPAIHSVSVTVVFEFEFSHPQLVEERRFWNLLGEEVDGEIVRLIVTKIVDYYEISLVYQGADRLAKIDVDDDDSEAMQLQPQSQNVLTLRRKETMKLTPEQMKALGITHEGDDVPEHLILPQLEKLISQAAQGEKLLTSARAEVLRVAKLAILGSSESELPKAIVTQINNANADECSELKEFYTKQFTDKVPADGRSSVEDTSSLPQTQTQQPVMHGVSLH